MFYGLNSFLSALGVGLACMLLSVPVAARVDLGNGWSPSAPEISQLPEFCQRQFQSKNSGKVYGALSPGCDGVHHLCAGKVLINRAMNASIPKRERQRILGQAKIEVNYLSSRLTPACNRGEDVRAAELHIRMLEVMLK